MPSLIAPATLSLNTMYHRYGRYGPFAWKHLQERKYVHRPAALPIPVVSTTMIVRVVVPPTIERVIVVIMQENGQIDEIEVEKQSIQISTVPGIEETPQISQGDSRLVSDAQWQAVSDANAVKAYTRNGKFVRIDRPRQEERIESFVHAYFGKLIASGVSTPGQQDYQNKTRKYKDAYLKRFDEELCQVQEQEQINYIPTPIEARLRDLAIQDRKTYPTPWRRSFHQRDLAVIRVLLELDISQDYAQQELEKIHDHADIYERYYTNPREEVRWPEQATF
jgi:hypothetical protein